MQNHVQDGPPPFEYSPDEDLYRNYAIIDPNSPALEKERKDVEANATEHVADMYTLQMQEMDMSSMDYT